MVEGLGFNEYKMDFWKAFCLEKEIESYGVFF
jgi:hypothetical protein